MTPPRPAGDLPDDPGPHHALAEAIRRHAHNGWLPSCAGSDRPYSDDPDERAQVARDWCPTCPVAAECHTAGQLEHHGVWGGQDRTAVRPPTRSNRRTRQETAA